ncbi:hypothetical protein Ancab_006779 [Ancistrocladus abbreviatus]
MASRNAASDLNVKARITCACSPTKHPGSFRCSFHKNSVKTPKRRHATSQSRNQWNSAAIEKANLLRAFLLQIIKPSSHGLRRRKNFQPRPSRFYFLNGNANGVVVS